MAETIEPQIILVDKPTGVTSHDVVNLIRFGLRRLDNNYRKIGVGHAGTLDPAASGLLIILVGAATKLQSYFMNSMKSYDFIIQLGQRSDTGDAEGEMIEKKPVPKIDQAMVYSLLATLTNKIVQPVPMYSAVKVKGHKLYEYARKNQEPPFRPIRVCQIKKLNLINYDQKKQQLDISVDCSAGTYVRSLAEQIAAKLGTVGHVISLRRTKSGSFDLKDATPLPLDLFATFRKSRR